MTSTAPAARPASTADDLIRGSDEYAAAFDLEVWKAQQQARLRSQLRLAKEELEKRMQAEFNRKRKQELAELDRTRRELEHMAQQLQAAGELLQRRSSQFEAREVAFEARRQKVAEQHERHLARVETRARQTVEESELVVTSLQAELHERDVAIAQLQERLQAAETEYDVLRRKAARYLSASGEGANSQRQRELEGRLAQADSNTEDMQRQLRLRLDDVDRLQRANATLERDLKASQDQLAELSRRHSQLVDQFHSRERSYLEQERQRLDTLQREQQRATRGAALLSQLLPASASPVPLPFSSSAVAAAGGRDDLVGMLQQLQQEVVAGLREMEPQASVGGHGAPQPVKYAERRLPPPPPSPPQMGPNATTTTTTTSAVVPIVVHMDGDDALHRSVSTLSDDIKQLQEEGAGVQAPAGVEVSAVSTNYAKADDSWLDGLGRELDLASYGSSTLPPLAPTRVAIVPVPEDFVQAAQHRATVEAADAAAHARRTREEMTRFVEQLKMNRQKLLDTGVYERDHPVVTEMGEKIRLYESYLQNHPPPSMSA